MDGRPQARLLVHGIQALIRVGGEQGPIGGFFRTASEASSRAWGFCCAQMTARKREHHL
jgi:hypothetical protein